MKKLIMNIKGTFLTAIFAILVVFTGVALAQINEQGAQQLKSLFENILEEQKTAFNGHLETDGNVLVEQADSYYAVTLPYLTMTSPEKDRLEIGIVAINATPTDKDGIWKMSVAVPTPITLYDKDNVAIFTAGIGKQSAVGIWHKDFHNFVQLKARYEDILLGNAETEAHVDISAIDITNNLKSDNNGLWSGPLDFTVSGMSALSVDDIAIKLGGIKATMDIFDYDIAQAAALREKLSALQDVELEPGEEPSKEQKSALIDIITGAASQIWDGFSLKNSLENLNVQIPTDTGPRQNVTLARGQFDFGMRGYREDSIDISLNLGYDDLKITPTPEDLEGMVPASMALKFSINNFPNKYLMEQGKIALEQGGEQAKNMGKMIATQTIMNLPDIMATEGTKINLDELSISNDVYDMKLNAVLMAEPDAVKKLVGKGLMELTGLEALMERSGQALSNPDLSPQKKQKIQGTIMALTTLSMMGQQTTGADGRITRTYDFELTADGKMMLNGTDMSMIMGAGEQPPPEDAPGQSK